MIKESNASSHHPNTCSCKDVLIFSSVWKPLRGPLDDWPLCVCDVSTVDVEADLVPSDQVFPQHVVENIQVHHDPNQKWYYLSKQRDDEIWIFCQSVGRSGERLKAGQSSSSPAAILSLTTSQAPRIAPFRAPRRIGAGCFAKALNAEHWFISTTSR